MCRHTEQVPRLEHAAGQMEAGSSSFLARRPQQRVQGVGQLDASTGEEGDIEQDLKEATQSGTSFWQTSVEVSRHGILLRRTEKTLHYIGQWELFRLLSWFTFAALCLVSLFKVLVAGAPVHLQPLHTSKPFTYNTTATDASKSSYTPEDEEPTAERYGRLPEPEYPGLSRSAPGK